MISIDCQRLDLNSGSEVLETTDLPIVPQPPNKDLLLSKSLKKYFRKFKGVNSEFNKSIRPREWMTPSQIILTQNKFLLFRLTHFSLRVAKILSLKHTHSLILSLSPIITYLFSLSPSISFNYFVGIAESQSEAASLCLFLHLSLLISSVFLVFIGIAYSRPWCYYPSLLELCIF